MVRADESEHRQGLGTIFPQRVGAAPKDGIAAPKNVRAAPKDGIAAPKGGYNLLNLLPNFYKDS